MEDKDKSISIIKSFIRYFISSIAHWRVDPKCTKSFIEKDYVGIRLKYMDPVDENLRVRNDNIYKITQWVESGIFQNMTTLQSFQFLIFHHERRILETFSCDLRAGLTKYSRKNDAASDAKELGDMKSQIRKLLESTLTILRRSTETVKGKVSMNILMKHRNNQEFSVDKNIIQKSLKDPLERVLSNVLNRDAIVEIDTCSNVEGNQSIEAPPLHQFSQEISTSSTSVDAHSFSKPQTDLSEVTWKRLGSIEFPRHTVEVFYDSFTINWSRKDHVQEINNFFQNFGSEESASSVRRSVVQSQESLKKRMKRDDILCSNLVSTRALNEPSPKNFLCANTPYPSSTKRMSIKSSDSDCSPVSNTSKNHTPATSPNHRVLFGDTPILHRRKTRRKMKPIPSITPKNLNQNTDGRSLRTPRSGSFSEEPTVILHYSTSESKNMNSSPHNRQWYFAQNSQSPVPSSKFSFSPE